MLNHHPSSGVLLETGVYSRSGHNGSRETGGVRAPANPVGGGCRHKPGGLPHFSPPPATRSQSTVQSQVMPTEGGINRSG